ncbi:MAG TPA: heat-inducible transcriptional repressor HrcA [Terriglobales bacterium]|nr:heat-inducible transcriptional repressor HrcA [Terriglobales bacterium]
MTNQLQLGPREREVLSAIVETYIISGEPIGSRTLSRANSEGLSPASIRNVMSDLTDAGYLEQPHTSAGRVPTSSAFQYYVEHLSSGRQISLDDKGRIEQGLSGITEVQQFMERTSHILSTISQNLAVAVAGGPKEVLEHIHFSALGDKKVLAVVITKSGVVRDKLLRMPVELSQSDLEIAARYINENFRGWTLESLRAEIQKRIEKERSEYDRLMSSIEALYREGALVADVNIPEVYFEGTANLLGNANQEKLRELFRRLEEKQRIVELLSAYLSAQQESVRVVFGLQDLEPQLRDFVLIGAPAVAGGEVVGSLAVIGPMRIDYQHTMTAVSYISQLFEKLTTQES